MAELLVLKSCPKFHPLFVRVWVLFSRLFFFKIPSVNMPFFALFYYFMPLEHSPHRHNPQLLTHMMERYIESWGMGVDPDRHDAAVGDGCQVLHRAPFGYFELLQWVHTACENFTPVTNYGSMTATVHANTSCSTRCVGTLCKRADSNRRLVLRVGGCDEVRNGPALAQRHDEDT